MNEHDFVRQEIDRWGEGYVETLLERGYKIVQSVDRYGNVKFGWLAPVLERQHA